MDLAKYASNFRQSQSSMARGGSSGVSITIMTIWTLKITVYLENVSTKLFVYKLYFAIVFCHPPSFVPIPPLPCPCSQHPSTLSSVFFHSLMSIICLQACSSGHLLTCPNNFIHLSVSLFDTFTYLSMSIHTSISTGVCMSSYIKTLCDIYTKVYSSTPVYGSYIG